MSEQYSQDDLIKRREAYAKFRLQRKQLEERRRLQRKQAFVRNIKLFIFVTGVIISGLIVFVLFNGAWDAIQPAMN
ncbi:MAG: hypothetical protein ACPGOY_08260 [Rhodospirillaceae bacterium]